MNATALTMMLTQSKGDNSDAADCNQSELGCQHVTLPSPLYDSFQTMRDVLDQVTAMRIQEIKTYSCDNYRLRNHSTSQADAAASLKMSAEKTTSQCFVNAKHDNIVDVRCREQIVEWIYRVLDHFSIRREIAAIAMSFLDRFTSANPSCDKNMYKIAASTALLLSVKIHEPSRLGTMAMLPQLNKGEFTMKHIVGMEKLMLRSLGWFVNPPTAVAFIGYFLSILFQTPSNSTQLQMTTSKSLFNLASYFSELTLLDHTFVTRKPSQVAYVALLDAIDKTSFQELAFERRVSFLSQLAAVFPDLHCDNDEIIAMREKLWALREPIGGGESTESKIHCCNNSPISVTRFGGKV